MSVDIWSLPGPRRLLRTMRQAVEGGRSVLLLHPDTVSMSGLPEQLGFGARRTWVHVDLRELERRPGTLAQRLLDHLGQPHLAEEGSVISLVRRMEGFALWLIPAEGAQAARELARFLELFVAAAARQESHCRALVVCACTDAAVSPVPRSEVALLRLLWWNQVTPLDTLVVVDEILGVSRVVGDREVIVELAAWDLDLAEDIARAWPEHPLSGALASVGPTAAEAQEVLALAASASAAGPAPEPPETLRAAWAAGAVNWWGDRAVAHLTCHLQAGDAQAVSRRIWRGQIAAVLPHVEVARERLALWVEQRRHLLAAAWRNAEIQALEAGELERAIRDSPQLRRVPGQMELVRLLRQARHKLAHLEHVDRETVAVIDRLVRSGPFHEPRFASAARAPAVAEGEPRLSGAQGPAAAATGAISAASLPR